MVRAACPDNEARNNMSDTVEEQTGKTAQQASERTPTSEERTLPMVVLGEVVIMPRIPIPLQIPTGKSYRAMEEAMEGDREVLTITVSEEEIEGYKGSGPQQLPSVGVIVKLEEFLKLPDNTVRVILAGEVRAEIIECVQNEPFYRVHCVPRPDPEVAGAEVEALMTKVKGQVEEIIGYMPEVSQEAVDFVKRIDQPGHLADVVAYGPAFELDERLDLLNTLDPMARLGKVQV